MSSNDAGQQFLFSAGNLFLIGDTPREAGIIQSSEVDFAGTTKSLQDTYQVSKLVVLADMKISGKFAAAEMNADLMNIGMAGSGKVTTGKQYKFSNEESFTLSTSTTTATVANSSGFETDLGVDDVTSVYKKISMSLFTDSALTSVGTVTVSNSSTGGSIAAGTYYVRCAKITSKLAATITLDAQAASMSIDDAGFGITAASTAVNTGAITGSTNEITASVPADSACGGYAWYVGTSSGAETLQEVTSTNTVTLTEIVAGGDQAPTSDTSAVVPTGYYKNISGVYSFNPTQCKNGLTVIPKYIYETDSAGGRIITITNKKQGLAPAYALYLSTTLVNQAKVEEQMSIYLYNVIISKLSMGMKIGELTYPAYEFTAFSTAANTIGWMSIGGQA